MYIYIVGNRSNSLLHKAIECGLKAPSAHNNQPWIIEAVGGKNRIVVKPDYDKVLLVGDKDKRLFYISLGCCVENIVFAAKAYAAEATVENYLSDKDDLDRIEIQLSRIDSELEKYNNSKEINALNSRVTNRFGYTLDGNEIESIKSLLLTTLCGHVQKLLIDKKSMDNEFVDIMLDAYNQFMRVADFRKELSYYVRNNLTKKKDGMPAYGMGIPTLVSFFAPILIKYVNLAAIERKKNKNIFENETPLWLILGVDTETTESWLSLGRAYEKLNLELAILGISTHIWASPTQSKQFRQQLTDLLSLQFIPSLTVRIGRATRDVQQPPKRDIGDVI